MKTTAPAASDPPRAAQPAPRGAASRRREQVGPGRARRRALPPQEPRTRPPGVRPCRRGGQGHHHRGPSPARRWLLPRDLPSAPGKAMLGQGRAGPRHLRSRRLERLCRKPPAEEAEGGAAPARCRRRSPLPHSPAGRLPRYRSAAPPLPRPFMAAAAPGRRSPLAAPPAPPGRPAASWAAASRPGAAPQQVGPGADGRRALRQAGGGGKGAAAGAGCSLLPGEAPATGATPASLPRGSGGARGGCSAPLRPALARGAVNGRPDGAGWGGQGRARPVRTLLRRVPLGAAGVVSLGRRQPFRALSVSRSSRGCTCGDGTGGGRHRDKDGASPPRGRGLSRS